MYKILKKSKKSQARLGKLKTAHGEIQTPFFMPIATKAAVKHLTADEVKDLGAQIILSNTYHLYLQPGMDVMKKAGGLHKFMKWNGPILTDSGGFQVFSLSKIRKILKDGVEFSSHIDGSKHLLTPKKVLEIQKTIGSDISMILDVCPPSTAKWEEVAQAVETTSNWAKLASRTILQWSKKAPNGKKFFCIVQGGIFNDLRLKSLQELKSLEKGAFKWDGFAVGGLAVGETNDQMYEVLDYLVKEMPEDRPRYLMGVGTPENIVQAVKRGVDMFDCVIPSREARHGRLYLWSSEMSLRAKPKAKRGNLVDYHSSRQIPPSPAYRQAGSPLERGGKFYETINISNAKYKNDFSPINDSNLKHYTKAYLYHLFKTGEPLGMRLATLNNVGFYLKLMERIREEIKNNSL